MQRGDATTLDVHMAIEVARCQHFLKAKPLWAVVDVVINNMDVLAEGPRPHYKTVQRRLAQVAAPTLTVLFWDREADVTKKLSGIKSIPKSKYPRPKWQLVYVVIHVNVKRVLLLHKSRHPGRDDDSVADISYDGVKLTNSCGRSFEVLSAMFSQCLEVYPLSIGIAERGFSDQLSAQDVIAGTLTELVSNGIRIRNIIPDHPKRAGEIPSNGMVNIYWPCHSPRLSASDLVKQVLAKSESQQRGCNCFQSSANRRGARHITDATCVS